MARSSGQVMANAFADSSIAERLEAAMQRCDDSVRATLSDIACEIACLTSDLEALAPDELANEHLPEAGAQLEAVVSATAQATHEIMDATETLVSALEVHGPKVQEPLANEAARIFQACAFQDVTSQRITKVISTLKLIGGRLQSLGFSCESGAALAAPQSSVSTGAPPMDGPALDNAGLDQRDIDKLFDDFG